MALPGFLLPVESASMPDLFSSPILFLALAGAVGALLALLKPAKQSRRRRASKRERFISEKPRDNLNAREPSDPISQIRQVAWRTKTLMNGAEYRTFCQLERLVAESGGGQRLFSQVSMGEILRVDPKSGDRSACTSAFNRVNAKRVDYLIIDRAGFPLAAIEYHGSGHYQANAEIRDRIKREAFRLAGVPFVEIARQGMSNQQLAELRGILGHAGLAAAE